MMLEAADVIIFGVHGGENNMFVLSMVLQDRKCACVYMFVSRKLSFIDRND